jgi:hypothetical protein
LTRLLVAEEASAWVPAELALSTAYTMQLLGSGSCMWPVEVGQNVTQISQVTTTQCLDACLTQAICVAATVNGTSCSLHNGNSTGLYRSPSGAAFCYEKQKNSMATSTVVSAIATLDLKCAGA